MAITPDAWQEALRRIIKTSPAKYKQAGIYSIYTIVAASAILPVLVAGRDWGTALVTLVGSLGANLITNLIQGSKDEVDIARKIETLSADDKTHEYIRLLLNKLDAVNVVRQGLPESDWIRFEMLFDRKLSEYKVGSHYSQVQLDAPILVENVDKKLAREIGYAAIKKAWWSERRTGKATLEICIWPIVFYDAEYMVTYQDKNTEDVRDSEGKVVDSRTIISEGMSSSKIRLAIFPTSITDRGKHPLPERVFSTLNGLEPERDLDWKNNRLAKVSYKYLCVPFLNSWIYQMFFGGLTTRINKVRYWENNKISYTSKPGELNISDKSALEEARHTAKRSFVHRWTTSNTKVLNTQPGQEQVRVVQYPFWIFEASSQHGLYQIVIEALGGQVIFMHAPASLASHTLVSMAGAIVLGIFLALAILMLWSVGTLVSFFI